MENGLAIDPDLMEMLKPRSPIGETLLAASVVGSLDRKDARTPRAIVPAAAAVVGDADNPAMPAT